MKSRARPTRVRTSLPQIGQLPPYERHVAPYAVRSWSGPGLSPNPTLP